MFVPSASPPPAPPPEILSADRGAPAGVAEGVAAVRAAASVQGSGAPPPVRQSAASLPLRLPMRPAEAPPPAAQSLEARESSRPAGPLAERGVWRRPSAVSPPPVASAVPTRPTLRNQKFSVSRKEDEEWWVKAEALYESKASEEVTVIGSNNGGVVVGFGTLVGFVPSSELAASRRPVPLHTWGQLRGLDLSTPPLPPAPEPAGPPAADPATARQVAAGNVDASSGAGSARDGGGPVAGGSQVPRRPGLSLRPTGQVARADLPRGAAAPPPPGLLEEQEAVEQQYKRERSGILASLVGTKIKVRVIRVERKYGQVICSEREAEGEDASEAAARKLQLMEELEVGDVVTCSVTSFNVWGALVSVKGVDAIIHISELSWSRVTDPSTVVQVGQELQTKVCRVDKVARRISLSLKQMQPDPLMETLDSLVEEAGLRGELEHMVPEGAPLSEEMRELEDVMARLRAVGGISEVRLGRRLRGSALAPAFQVYLSSQWEDGYKLLARAGTEVQEVFLKTALEREAVKDAVRDSLVVNE